MSSEPEPHAQSSEPEPHAELGRRGLLVGGAAALAAGGVLAVAGPGLVDAAGAQPLAAGDGTEGVAPSPHVAGSEPQSSPITTTIGSAPISGFTYRNVCMYDFEPFDPNAHKTWGGSGVYSAVTATSMRAIIDIPAGALLQDVEYYIYNNTGSSAFPDTYLYVPGQGTIVQRGGFRRHRLVLLHHRHPRGREPAGPVPVGLEAAGQPVHPVDGHPPDQRRPGGLHRGLRQHRAAAHACAGLRLAQR